MAKYENRVSAVLLRDDGWHGVKHGTFEIDQAGWNGEPSFDFLPASGGNRHTAGPLSSILAVRFV